MRKLYFPKLTLDGSAFLTQNGLYIKKKPCILEQNGGQFLWLSFITFIQEIQRIKEKNQKAIFSKFDTRWLCFFNTKWLISQKPWILEQNGGHFLWLSFIKFIQGIHRIKKNEKARFSRFDTRWLCFFNTKWLVSQKRCILEQNGGNFLWLSFI